LTTIRTYINRGKGTRHEACAKDEKIKNKKMNILITGGNGQLGNEMRKISTRSVSDSYFFTDVTELDITKSDDIRQMMKEKQISVVVNCAAYTNVDKAEDNEELADLLNHKAAENLAVACKEQDALLIHISTDYVFGGLKNTPISENEPVNPLAVYGKTKLDGEKAVINSGCRYLIFRTAWLYSSFGNNFVKTMLKLTREKDKLSVVFDQVGSPTYAGDLASVIFKAIEERLYNQHQGIYHFTDEGVCSWYDFTVEIAELSGQKCDVQPCHSNEFPSKVKRPSFSVLDKTKVKKDFGVIIPHWKVSLKKCIKEITGK